MYHYEVQKEDFFDGWKNIWYINNKPMRFGNRQDAQEEIDDTLFSMLQAVGSGNMDKEALDVNLRIVRVWHPKEIIGVLLVCALLGVIVFMCLYSLFAGVL